MTYAKRVKSDGCYVCSFCAQPLALEPDRPIDAAVSAAMTEHLQATKACRMAMLIRSLEAPGVMEPCL